MGVRDKTIAEVRREALRKNAQAKMKKRTRAVKRRPWKVLASEWQEETWRVFGKECGTIEWGPAESKLARAYLKEVEFDSAIELVKRFITWWSEKGKEGMPPFRYFWTVRNSFRTMVEGTTKESVASRRKQEREYDRGNDEVDGWGDIFEAGSA